MSDNKDKPFDTLNLSEVSDIVTDSADDAVDVETTVDVENTKIQDDAEAHLLEEKTDLNEPEVSTKEAYCFWCYL